MKLLLETLGTKAIFTLTVSTMIAGLVRRV